MIIYNLSQFIRSYFLLCLRINKTVNSYILYQLLAKKYEIVLQIVLDIILQYSSNEELFVKIFSQNQFLLDEILDQVMFLSSVNNCELFVFV